MLHLLPRSASSAVPSELLDAYTRTRPVITVDLDAGVFFWLKEIIDSKHRTMLDHRPPEYKEMVARAAVALQDAIDAKEAAIKAATAPPKPVPKIKRREPAQEPQPVRRIKRSR